MTAPARRGRPRDEAVDSAVLAAAVDELIERGFAALSIERIAARAGVAKTTVYRRWPSAHELAVDAMRTFEQDVRNPPEGSVRDQLVWLVDAMRRKWNDPRYSAIMRRVTADGVANPDAYRRARDKLVAPHLAVLTAVLRRGVDEGVIRADVDFDWVRQMITAPIMAAALTFKDRVSKAQVEFSVDAVLRGVAP